MKRKYEPNGKMHLIIDGEIVEVNKYGSAPIEVPMFVCTPCDYDDAMISAAELAQAIRDMFNSLPSLDLPMELPTDE